MKMRLAGVVILLIGAAAVAAPYAIWWWTPERRLDVAVLDNTVPDETYREHRGLFWVLNQQKYTSSTHGAYRAERDYYGFFPRPRHRYAIRPLPTPLDADLIYLADTYGVYQKEWYGANPLGERSPRIYGGMRREELAKVEEAVGQGTPLVVEFNAFASPTDAATRERLYDLLQVEWSGWIGRYFNELRQGVEVPVWAVEAYQRQYHKRWEFTGEGFVLAGENDAIIVLLPGSDFSGGQCEAIFTDSARARLHVESRVHYRYWFDIVRLRDGVRELAHFNLDLTRAGLARLARYDLPSSFPAVVSYDAPRYRAYYFAGDFVDTESVPRYHQAWGHDRLKAWFTSDRPQLENQAFFWRVYVPMMRTILDEAYNRSTLH